MSDLSAEKVVAELRADLAKMPPGEREFWTARLTPMFDLIAQQAARLEEVTRERDEARLAERIECKVGQLDRLFIGKGEYVRAVDAQAALTAAEAEVGRLKRELEIERTPRCFACGAEIVEDCRRPPDKACGREHEGGTRACLSSKKEG